LIVVQDRYLHQFLRLYHSSYSEVKHQDILLRFWISS